MPESAFQQQILALAARLGWRTAHFRPAQNRRGDWRTPVAGDGKGFPDTVLLRGERIVVAELKSERGRVSKEQRAWLDAWGETSAEVHVWKPSMWDAIVEVLR